MLKGVIFDLDGVIVSTDMCHYEAWKALADQEGIYFDFEINKRLRGVSRMESLEIILEKAEKSYTTEEKVALATQKNELYKQLIKKLTPNNVLPGVKRLLTELKAKGIKTAIGSSSKNAEAILEYIQMKDVFDVIVQGTDINYSKPHPEVFLKAANRLGLQPEACMVIEDATAGIEAANAANMKAVYIGSKEEKVEALMVCKDLTELSIQRILSISEGE